MKLIDHVINIRYKIERAFDNRFSRMGFKPEGVEAMADDDDENAARRCHIGDIIAIHQRAVKTTRMHATKPCQSAYSLSTTDLPPSR